MKKRENLKEVKRGKWDWEIDGGGGMERDGRSRDGTEGGSGRDGAKEGKSANVKKRDRTEMGRVGRGEHERGGRGENKRE